MTRIRQHGTKLCLHPKTVLHYGEVWGSKLGDGGKTWAVGSEKPAAIEMVGKVSYPKGKFLREINSCDPAD